MRRTVGVGRRLVAPLLRGRYPACHRRSGGGQGTTTRGSAPAVVPVRQRCPHLLSDRVTWGPDLVACARDAEEFDASGRRAAAAPVRRARRRRTGRAGARAAPGRGPAGGPRPWSGLRRAGSEAAACSAAAAVGGGVAAG